MITNAEREVFCQALADNETQAEAGRRAGIKKSAPTLHRLAHSREVRARVEQLKLARHQLVYDGDLPDWLTPAWIGAAFKAIYENAIRAGDFRESMRALKGVTDSISLEEAALGPEERPTVDMGNMAGWLASLTR
jgi:hypothetical protein